MADINTLQKGLVAHYPLNGEYETKDITPNANHGTNNGATLSTGRKGEANGSYVFDGTDDYINTLFNPSSELGQDFTISAYIYPETTGNYKGVGGGHNPTYQGIFFSQWEGSTWTCGFGDGVNSYPKALYSLSLNQWSHLVCIYSGGNYIKVYVNGILVSSNMSVGSIAHISNFWIGKAFNTINRYFDGSISDVRIYNRALEEDEIKLLYDSFKPEIATSDLNKGLVGHWMLDSENGAKDLTPNGNDGTVSGATVGSQYTSFDGVDDSIPVNSVINNLALTTTSNETMSVWINPVAYDGTQNFFGFCDVGVWEHYFLFGLRDGYISCQLKGLSGPYVHKKIDYDYGSGWIHLVAVKTNNTISNFYINGVDNSTSIGDENITSDVSATAFDLGRVFSTAYSYKGEMSNFKIYNRALSADEVKLLYEKGRY